MFTKEIECPECGGKELCTTCGGDGYVGLTDGFMEGIDNDDEGQCPTCHGDKSCTRCDGKGVIEDSDAFWDEVGL